MKSRPASNMVNMVAKSRIILTLFSLIINPGGELPPRPENASRTRGLAPAAEGSGLMTNRREGQRKERGRGI
jgi:hypothetical protein